MRTDVQRGAKSNKNPTSEVSSVPLRNSSRPEIQQIQRARNPTSPRSGRRPADLRAPPERLSALLLRHQAAHRRTLDRTTSCIAMTPSTRTNLRGSGSKT
jgi:hypothetical protein